MRWILSIPLFLYLLIAANFVMIAGPVEESMMNIIITEFMLPSTRHIIITVSDLLIIASLLFLYIETFKATRTSTASIIDHVLSLVVFLIFFVEFLIVPRLGNTTFLIMMVGALMDVVMGFTVTISTARRDFTTAHPL
jgi:hypothetical protein